MSKEIAKLRQMPAVDEVLRTEQIAALLQKHPRVLVVESIREALDEIRNDLINESDSRPLERDVLISDALQGVYSRVAQKARPALRRVLNATGVVLHTNLGRSILSVSAREAVSQVAQNYCNLELNLASGKRGSRYSLVEDLLVRLTGAESALVVNNNAGAVLLAVGTLAKGRSVIVSRGQLVEIGGSFRIPDVMEQSGARLVEVGTTNKTHLRDYRRAIDSETNLLLHVHTSNYRIVGFTHETSVKELAELGGETGLPVMSDLGSGFLIDLSPFGLPYEPTVQETVADGADVVTFSGDKLLGGPQAGIIVGRKEIIDRMKKNPLTRALRADKLTLAALQATLREYLDPELALHTVPTLRMLTMDLGEIEQKATRLAGLIRTEAGDYLNVSLENGASQVGGGAMPTADPPTVLVALRPHELSVEELTTRLRNTDPALVGRVHDLKLLLDTRTLRDEELPLVARVLRQVCTEVTK
ncbi:MAG: L-seryl-tRNA(Sec) selenium transferase [Eubacteriales bacterium]|jgi:L-seryl-tRNA(Ser) seleniumtransferase|nr:L-seryl-tRNA(Sec) selenium transferase [Bacillota bacterium]MBV1726866.1 L-seryl-tRNA(Sec) selenium transferase [Desulforudis sp.]MDP3051097.1 L-seryl-tRNA(Sec) selenium transferase [Eubacteriales bacterium]MDQ7788565.1 L-seryl-tRNA(Sec) selenium transferase [Clostridia bacterium]MBV1736039.1 L-seryl-tRNA(Sec) selenium transferase [Desulforudis sp.]